MTNRIIGGVGAVSIDGRQVLARAQVKVKLGGPLRETVTGVDGVHGFKQSATPWSATIDVSTPREADIAALQKAEDATILIEMLNGKSIKLFSAWQVGELELDAVEGQVSVTFEAKDGSIEQ